CLLPLIDPDETRAVALATEAVHAFAGIYQAEWLARFGAKIGLAAARAEDEDLIGGLLDLMAAEEADFTRTFRGLAEGAARDEFVDRAAFDAWAGGWQARLAQEPGGMAGAQARMA